MLFLLSRFYSFMRPLFSLGLLHHFSASHYTLIETSPSKESKVLLCDHDSSNNLDKLYKALSPLQLHKRQCSVFAALDASMLETKSIIRPANQVRRFFKQLLQNAALKDYYHQLTRSFDMDPNGIVYQHYQVAKSVMDPLHLVFKKLKIPLRVVYCWEELRPVVHYYRRFQQVPVEDLKPSTMLAYCSSLKDVL